MDTDANSVYYSSPKKEILADTNKRTNEIVDAGAKKNIQSTTIDRRKNAASQQHMYDSFLLMPIRSLLLFSRRYWCCSVLNLSSKPVCLLPIVTTIIMVIGILRSVV